MKHRLYIQAVKTLVGHDNFFVEDNNGIYSVVFMDNQMVAPKTEIEAEVARLQAEYDAQQYARDRAAEYPPMADYLDGIVKGDQAQIDAYIAACQAVKAKYPKPE
jgi:hypothetical protein